MDSQKLNKYNVIKGKQRGAIKVLARVIEVEEKKCAAQEGMSANKAKKKPRAEEFLKRRRIRIPRELLDLVEYSRRFQ